MNKREIKRMQTLAHQTRERQRDTKRERERERFRKREKRERETARHSSFRLCISYEKLWIAYVSSLPA